MITVKGNPGYNLMSREEVEQRLKEADELFDRLFSTAPPKEAEKWKNRVASCAITCGEPMWARLRTMNLAEFMMTVEYAIKKGAPFDNPLGCIQGFVREENNDH